ncbi:MAG: glycosyltransferase [Bacteroidetes bacterium]|nr:glycosyltransferase [Bacteroidota bacterium]
MLQRPPEVAEQPTISMIISLYNEESVISEKLANINSIDYPTDKLTVFFGLDSCSDHTEELIRSTPLKFPVRLIHYPERRGKIFVLFDLVMEAKSELLFFSDGNTMLQPDAIRNMTPWFQNPVINGVCGMLSLVPKGEMKWNEVLYWDYETRIKSDEGSLGYCIGANGGNYLIRKSAFPFSLGPGLYTDDFVIGLASLLDGGQFVFDSKSKAIEEDTGNRRVEFKRKIRIGKSNLSTLIYIRSWFRRLSLTPVFFLISHKMLRWLVPLVMVFVSLLLVVNTVIFGSFWCYLCGVVLFAHLLSTILFLMPASKFPVRFIDSALYIILMNWALFFGYVRFFLGSRESFWSSTIRK